MEGGELPVGWVEVPIGDLCELRNGRAFKPAEWSDEGIPIVRIQNLNNRQAKFNHFQGEVDANHLLSGGELLFAWSGTPGTSFGAHIWEGGKAALNQHIFRVDFDEGSLQKDFFRYAINQKLNDLIDIAHGGVGLRHVTKGKFEHTEVCLPPLKEQHRIAAKLDTTLAAVEACRQRLDGVAGLLKRFRQAVLAAATSGELTREWRGENTDADQWESTTFGAAYDYITVGFVGKMADQYVEHGVPFLRSLNVRPFRFDSENLAFISPEFHQSIIKSSLLPGDLAVVRTGAPGQCCVIPDELSEANCSDLVIARPGSRLIADFGAIVINSSLGQGFVKSEQVGVAQAHFNVGSMKRAPLHLPSIAEQQEIVRRAQNLFTLADQLEARLIAARKVVDRLTPALLAKAFRGELVPQDPADEPASVLLARIRVARQAEAGAARPSRRGRPKAAANPEPIDRTAAPAPSDPLPPDLLTQLLRECGALSERALLAASELEPEGFVTQLERELQLGLILQSREEGQVLLEAVA
jgi:type I restriction enzyme S subunit